MENEKFCFELTDGPYGDETCNYNVTFPENTTLRDLFKFISKRNEWGSIHRGDRCFDQVVAKYTSEGNFSEILTCLLIFWTRNLEQCGLTEDGAI